MTDGRRKNTQNILVAYSFSSHQSLPPPIRKKRLMGGETGVQVCFVYSSK